MTKLFKLPMILLAISLLGLLGCAPGISEADYNRVLAERDQARTQVAALEDEVAALEEEVATLTEKLAAFLPALSLEITSPEDGATVTESLVIVSGTVSDPKATVKVNDVEVEVGEDGTFSADVELAEGENIITVVTALDEETLTKTVTVTYTPSE
jgi:outer membrane murein-binding lipoprotein Lpp